MSPAALLLLASPAFAASSHVLTVHVQDGKASYSESINASDGQQGNFSGPLHGRGGGARNLIVNALLTPGKTPDSYNIEYQLELSGGPRGDVPTLQAQGAVGLRRGVAQTVVECGAWKVELGVDTSSTDDNPADFGVQEGNVRVTAEVSRGTNKARCRQTMEPGTQGNLVESRTRGGRKSGFVMSLLPTSSARGVALKYQLESTPALGGGTVQTEGTAPLTFGQKDDVAGRGYKLQFLAEGVVQKEKPPEHSPEEGAAVDDAKAVPMLR